MLLPICPDVAAADDVVVVVVVVVLGLVLKMVSVLLEGTTVALLAQSYLSLGFVVWAFRFGGVVFSLFSGSGAVGGISVSFVRGSILLTGISRDFHEGEKKDVVFL